MNIARKQIRALTGIRGVVALWVMVHHLVTQYAIAGNAPDWLEAIAYKGWLGVDLFFILSGFVISYVHQKDFQEGVTVRSYWRFTVLRFARVYPVHFVTTVSLIPIYLFASHFFNYQSPVHAFTVSKLAYNLTLTNGLGIEGSVGLNAPSWSVGSEVFAYLLFPFLTFIVMGRLPAWASLPGCLLIIVITTGIGWSLSDGERYIASWSVNLLRIASEFSIGCLLYNLYQQKQETDFWWLSVAATIALVIMVALGIPNRWDVLFIAAFALLIIGLAKDTGPVARVLSTRCLTYLGEISYSIYLCHGVIFMILNSTLPKILQPDNLVHASIAAVIYLSGVWLTSHLTYKLVEVKARRYILNSQLISKE